MAAALAGLIGGEIIRNVVKKRKGNDGAALNEYQAAAEVSRRKVREALEEEQRNVEPPKDVQLGAPRNVVAYKYKLAPGPCMKTGGWKAVDSVFAASPVDGTAQPGCGTGLLRVPTAASGNSLCYIATGTGETQRVGRSIRCRQIEYKFCIRPIYLAASNTLQDITPSIYRVAIVLDKYSSGTVATFDTVFAAANYTGNISPNVVPLPLNRDQRERFSILADHTGEMDRGYIFTSSSYSSATSVGRSTYPVYQGVIDVDICSVYATDIAGTAANPQTNSIAVHYATNYADETHVPLYMQGYFRLYYEDE